MLVNKIARKLESTQCIVAQCWEAGAVLQRAGPFLMAQMPEPEKFLDGSELVNIFRGSRSQ